MSQSIPQPKTTTHEGLKVIITGGAGCIGFATIKALLKHHPNAQIHVLDLTTPSLETFPFSTFAQHKDQLHFHETDITSPTSLSAVFEAVRPQAVIHTASIIPSAARKRQLSNEGLWKINVEGTKNVLDIAERTEEVRGLVYTSSCDAVKPDSWMDFVNATEAETQHLKDREVGKWDKKAAAESLILSTDLRIKTCAIRTHGVVGTLDQNLFPLVATSPRKISLGSGKNMYDFSSADNVGLAHVLAMNNLLGLSPKNGGKIDDDDEEGGESANRRAFFVTDGTPKPFRELQEMIWRVVDNDPEKNYGGYTVIPVWLFKAILRFAGLFTKTAISPDDVGDAVSTRYYDISEATRVLGYRPERNKGLEESMRDAFEWWKTTTPTGLTKDGRK
uniref:Sterol-4-alpha-carboxylate 3-dehydrogenase, decarboxylating n=1 Tax=Talaromyces marneffei PM1 TaxID=1077442 RepID=A0A093XJE1_TALMA